MMYPHADVAGRLDADPLYIKGQIVTFLEYTIPKIQSCLEDLNHVGLIILYTFNEQQYLEMVRFGDFQKLNPDREAPSEIPAPPVKRRCWTKAEYNHVWDQWEKAGRVCPICKEKAEFISGRGWVASGYIHFQIDHIIPISKGGTYDLDNLQVICQKCNGVKGNNITLELLKSHPELSESTPHESNLSKVKLSKEKELKYPPFVSLSKEELKVFEIGYGKTTTKLYIDKINDYISSTGRKPYKDYAATIRNWMRKDNTKMIPAEDPVSIKTDDRSPEEIRMDVNKLTDWKKNSPEWQKIMGKK